MGKVELKGKDSREKQRTSGLTISSPLILRSPKVEIPKWIFSLISSPLVLFRRTFKG
jgi:hypothetical protein